MWLVGRNYSSYRTTFLPRFAPSGLLALLWTVLMMFAEMSKPLLSGSVGIGNIFWVCVPLLASLAAFLEHFSPFGKFLPPSLKCRRGVGADLKYVFSAHRWDGTLLTVYFEAYFILMFFLSWAVAKLLRANSAQTITFAFTAASNNFELALAACTAIFGTSSNQVSGAVCGGAISCGKRVASRGQPLGFPGLLICRFLRLLARPCCARSQRSIQA